MIKSVILRMLRRWGYDLVRVEFSTAGQQLVVKPLDPVGVEVLADPAFQASCREVFGLTLLDTPRLANLWTLCRLSNPAGQVLEVGAYRGGSALHLSNSCPERRLIVCDSFSGFDNLDPVLDHAFKPAMFRDASCDAVRRLFTTRQRQARVVAGYFPESCAGLDLRPLSFVHLDVDTYRATGAALEFVAPLMIERSLIISDDYSRTADGVNRAIGEFLARHHDWAVFPLFPSQALLVPESWFGCRLAEGSRPDGTCL